MFGLKSLTPKEGEEMTKEQRYCDTPEYRKEVSANQCALGCPTCFFADSKAIVKGEPCCTYGGQLYIVKGVCENRREGTPRV